MNSLGLPILILLFLIAAAAVWVAGIRVSQTTDVLSRRWGLGANIGGMVLLAIVTNLPETAIVTSGAARGDLSVAVGNILGGIAAQTVVLAILDRVGPRRNGPLTFRAADLSLVLEGVLVIAILGLVVAGTQMPKDLVAFRITPIGVMIALTWVFGVRLIARHQDHLPWVLAETAKQPIHSSQTQSPETPTSRHDHASDPSSATKSSSKNADGGVSHWNTRRVTVVFLVGAIITLLAGVALEQTSDAIADKIGMSGAIFGATVLAAATSLPELSTGITSLRLGQDSMAISDIFGGNAFLPVLFFPAALISGKAVLPNAHTTDIYLTALGVILTTVYITGLLLRSRQRVWGMGKDSLAVILIYLLGVLGLAVL